MTATWDGKRKQIPDQDLDEMELIGNRMFTVGVPAGADAEFKAVNRRAILTRLGVTRCTVN